MRNFLFRLVNSIEQYLLEFKSRLLSYLYAKKWFVNRNKLNHFNELNKVFKRIEDKGVSFMVNGALASDGLNGRVSRFYQTIELSFIEEYESSIVDVFKHLGYNVMPKNFHKTTTTKPRGLIFVLYCWRTLGKDKSFIILDREQLVIPNRWLGSSREVELEGLQFSVPDEPFLSQMNGFTSLEPSIERKTEQGVYPYKIKMKVYDYD